MSSFEAEIILEQHSKEYKNTWEQTRLIAYYCAAPFIKIKLKEVMPFSWYKAEVKEEISAEELEQRKQNLIDLANRI